MHILSKVFIIIFVKTMERVLYYLKNKRDNISDILDTT